MLRVVVVTVLLTLINTTASAQTVPDESLGDERSVIRDQVVFGGARRGDALFHSFSEFNVRRGQSLLFSDPGVANIFSRVTGDRLSRINGDLGVLGDANLFFSNPNGIIFGRNARLLLSGSFLATTAESLDFGAYRFSSASPEAVPPILTVSVPTGLSFGRPSDIVLRSGGHNLRNLQNVETGSDPETAIVISPFENAGLSLSGLRVQESERIALIGGQVTTNGGIITAPSGRINVQAVGEQDYVEFNPRLFRVQPGQLTGDLQFRNLSLLDVSSFPGANRGGRINIAGGDISVLGGSYLLNQNLGSGRSGGIDVIGDSLIVRGNLDPQDLDPNNLATIPSGIVGYSVDARSEGINLSIRDDITFTQAGGIRTVTLGSAPSGNISVSSRSLSIGEGSPFAPILLSLIQTFTVAEGDSGDIFVETDKLEVLEGGFLSSFTAGLPDSLIGDAGDVSITAEDILVRGAIDPFLISVIGSFSISLGGSGNVLIDTDTLSILDGGLVGSPSFFGGNSGNADISANVINIDGADPSILPSLVDADSTSLGTNSQLLVGNPNYLDSDFAIFNAALGLEASESNPFSPVSGDAGLITIDTQSLTIADGGVLVAVNEGVGASGSITVNADTVTLDRGGVFANSIASEGGNIDITSDQIVLQGESVVSALAIDVFETANARGIDIDATLLQLSPDSAIRATAQRGIGGNINIDTTFFSGGLVTAEAGGVDGTVSIDELNIPINDSVRLAPIEPPTAIASRCLGQSSSGNQFVISGRQQRTVSDSLPIGAYIWSRDGVDATPEGDVAQGLSVNQAGGMRRNSDGTVDFYAGDRQSPATQDGC